MASKRRKHHHYQKSSPNVVEKRKNGQNYKLFRKKTSGTQVLTISFCKYVGIGNNYGHFYFQNYKEKRYFLLTLLTNISCPYTLKKVESRMAKESLGICHVTSLKLRIRLD